MTMYGNIFWVTTNVFFYSFEHYTRGHRRKERSLEKDKILCGKRESSAGGTLKSG